MWQGFLCPCRYTFWVHLIVKFQFVDVNALDLHVDLIPVGVRNLNAKRKKHLFRSLYTTQRTPSGVLFALVENIQYVCRGDHWSPAGEHSSPLRLGRAFC